MAMKAREKANGEIVEVKEWRGASDVVYSTLDMGIFYQSSELDFNIGPPQTEIKISGWVAAEPFGEPFIYHSKPKRIAGELMGYWRCDTSYPDGRHCYCLGEDIFPSMTWQDEPIPVEIIIKKRDHD